MRILFIAIICIVAATPALGLERSPDERGLRGSSVERGGLRDERGRNAETAGARDNQWSGKTHGDGRR